MYIIEKVHAERPRAVKGGRAEMYVNEEEIRASGRAPTPSVIEHQRKEQLAGLREIRHMLRGAPADIGPQKPRRPAEPYSWARGL